MKRGDMGALRLGRGRIDLSERGGDSPEVKHTMSLVKIGLDAEALVSARASVQP